MKWNRKVTVYTLGFICSICALTEAALAEQTFNIRYQCEVAYDSNVTGYKPAAYDRDCTSSIYFLVDGLLQKRKALSCKVTRGNNICFSDEKITIPDGDISFVGAYTSSDISQYERRKKCVYATGTPHAFAVEVHPAGGTEYWLNAAHTFSCVEPIHVPVGLTPNS